MAKTMAPEQKEKIVQFVLDNLSTFRQLVLIAGAENYSTRKSPRNTLDGKTASRLMMGANRK